MNCARSSVKKTRPVIVIRIRSNYFLGSFSYIFMIYSAVSSKSLIPIQHATCSNIAAITLQYFYNVAALLLQF